MNGDKRKDDIEIVDELAGLIKTLPRVSAPNDFENNLFRRIRSQGDVETVSRFPWLKIAVPTAALVSLAAFFGISNISFDDVPSVAVVDNSTPTTIATHESGREQTMVQPSVDPQTPNVSSLVRNEGPNPKSPLAPDIVRSSNGDGPKRSNGGAADMGANPEKRPVYPKGFDPDSKTSPNAPGFGPTTTVRLIDIIQTAGIRTKVLGEEFVVEAIAANSKASRAGVIRGDIIDAINGVRMTGSATITGRIDIRTISVRRDGRQITLNF